MCGCKGDQDLLRDRNYPAASLYGDGRGTVQTSLGMPADSGALAAALETRCLPRCVCLAQSDSQYFPFFPQWVFASVINSGNQLRLGGTKAWSG